MKKLFTLVLLGCFVGFAGCGDDDGGSKTSGNIKIDLDDIDRGIFPNVTVNADCPADFVDKAFCQDENIRLSCSQGKVEKTDCTGRGGCAKIKGRLSVRCADDMGEECNRAGQWWAHCGVDESSVEKYTVQLHKQCLEASNGKAYLFDEQGSKKACASECRTDGTCKVEVCGDKFVRSCSGEKDAILWCKDGYVVRTACGEGEVCKSVAGADTCAK
ncbi:MAG: hypothetical protein FWC40_03075 [Proteobacteria bacterium]|nr:hypothetical protein [Pseudomonadota bacterium]